MDKMEVSQQRGVSILKITGDIENEDGRHILETIRASDTALPFWLIDVPTTRFFDSAALEALTDAYVHAESHGKKMFLTSVTPDVREILHITGLDKQIPVRESVEEVLQQIFRQKGDPQ